MVKINLRKLYPFYEKDCFVELSDEVVKTLMDFERSEEAYKRKLRRYKAYYSLDCNDGLEREIVFLSVSPEEIFERKVTHEELHAAMTELSSKQSKRIYAHCILGMTVAQIAKSEGVNWHSVNNSIRCGLERLEKILKK